jgi:hypothetical protein
MADSVTPQILSSLRKAIVECFNSSDLRLLCADLGMDYEDLGGEGKEAKVLELVNYFSRRGKTDQLLAYCQQERPEFAWPVLGGAAPTEANRPEAAKTAGEKITILFLAADPSNETRLRLGEELREIQEKLQLSRQRERFTVQSRFSVRPQDISQAMLDEQPTIVHFSGHGTEYGELCFEDNNGLTKAVSAQALSALFAQFSGQVQGVILNACYAETQAKAIAQHINYVVGMNTSIGDRASVAFSIGFYQALGAGKDIAQAFQFGVTQIMLQGIPEELTPVLITKK